MKLFPVKGLFAKYLLKGSNEESKSIHAFLYKVRLKVGEHYRLLMNANKTTTSETIKNAYLGISEGYEKN